MQAIPFDEIDPNSNVRYTIIAGKQYLSVRDLIMIMCCKDNKRASETWDRLDVSHKDELAPYCMLFQFPGRGQGEQPVIAFPGAIILSMFLPGENAKKHRLVMCNIIRRYYAGDMSLIDEVMANAASDHPIAEMARESLNEDQRDANELEEDKRRKRALEDVELQCKRMELKHRGMEMVSSFTNLMSTLNPDWKKDTRLVLQTEDLLKNIAFSTMTDQSQTSQNGDKPHEITAVTLSQYAQQFNKSSAPSYLSKVGKILASKYRTKYNKNPGQHKQYVDGAVRNVNSYTEQDYYIIEAAFNECP